MGKSFFRRHRRFIITESAAVLLIAALWISQNLLAASLPSQQAAGRWAQDSGTRFAQVSCYLDRENGLSEDAIYSLRSAINSALTQASITPETKSARLWFDAYSVELPLSLSTLRGSVTAQAMGVGGDFFLIHPFELHDGYYFSADDLQQDRILLDEDAAWQLFGSYDVTGLEVSVQGRPMIVAGVFKPESDGASAAVYGDAPRAYVSFAALLSQDPELKAYAYEAVLPDPVTGFAMQILSEKISAGENARELAENSARFRTVPLLRLLQNFGQQGVRRNAVIPPYWENAARIAQSHAALLLLLRFLLLLIPAVGAVTLLVRAWRGRTIHFRDIPDYYERLRGFLAEKLPPLLRRGKALLKKKEKKHEKSTAS